MGRSVTYSILRAESKAQTRPERKGKCAWEGEAWKGGLRGMVVVGRASDVSQLGEVDDLDEEPGEVIESAPPLRVGQERELNNSGLKKKLLCKGIGWETPDFGDEVTGIYPLRFFLCLRYLILEHFW